jgi:hypothetical protein
LRKGTIFSWKLVIYQERQLRDKHERFRYLAKEGAFRRRLAKEFRVRRHVVEAPVFGWLMVTTAPRGRLLLPQPAERSSYASAPMASV